MINCIIVDDEVLAQNVLEKYISMTPELRLIKKLDNAIDTISFLKENNIGLIFLDIKMPELSGLKMLKTIDNQPKVILTTAYSEYALESYDYSVIDYLLKPIEVDRFLIAVNKAIKIINLEKQNNKETIEQEIPEYIFVYQDQITHKIPIDEIIYIKAEGNYISIKTVNKNYVTRSTMNEIEDKLNNNFVRVHKSFVVALNKIEQIYGNTVKINDEKIPIGSHYKMRFIDRLKE